MYLATDHFSTTSPIAAVGSCTAEVLHEQGSGEQNEDVVLQTADLFGVFDGATSLDSFHDDNGATGGFCAAALAALAFRDSEESLERTADRANRTIREAQLRCHIPLHERRRLWSTSMAVVRLNGSVFEYCYTGDSMILLLYADDSQVLLTPEPDIDGETLRHWQELPASAQPIHVSLAEQIEKVRLRMNVSYGVLNGEPEAMQFIRHGRCRLEGISDILLFTDGFMVPRETPGEKGDWQSFSALYRLGGLGAIRDHVRRLQRQDPGCRRFPRFKMHDDIGAVAVTLPQVHDVPEHITRRSS